MFKRFRETPLHRVIPWRGPITDTAMLLDNGSVLAMFAVDGCPWETVDAANREAEHNRYNMTLRNSGLDTMVVTTYECRGEATPDGYPRGRFRSAFAETLDINYRDRLYDHSLYDNRTFLVIEIRPNRPAGEWVGKKVEQHRKAGRDEDGIRVRLERLERICSLYQADLARYGITRLRAAKRRGRMWFCEIAEAIALALTGQWRPVPLTTGAVARAMLGEYIVFGWETHEIRAPGTQQFAAMFGMKGYPPSYWPGMFAHLKATAYRHTTMHSFRCMSQMEGQDILTRKQNKMVTAGDKAFSQIGELATAADKLARNEFIMGDHAFAMCVFADTPRALNEVASMAWRDLSGAGIMAARENLGSMSSWLSLIPGNHDRRVRPGAISSRAYTAFCPLHGHPAGAKKGYWGEPLCILRSSGGTPYRFHLHTNGVGNIFVTGKIGSGKTVGLGFLMAQAEKTGAQIFVCDKDRGLELAVRALNGSYCELKNGVPFVTPFKALDGTNQDDVVFLRGLLRASIMKNGGQAITPEEDRRLIMGLDAVMREAPADRWISDIRAFLPHGDPLGAAARLEKWEWGRELGWILDGPRQEMDMTAPVVGVDQTFILDNADARGPILATLFHLWTANPEGQRRIFVWDEFWRSLQEPMFVALIQNGLATWRKFNWPMILATQSPATALQSPIAHTIREQCPTGWHFANPAALMKDYGPDGIGLDEAAVHQVANLPEGQGMFVMRQGEFCGVMQIALHGMNDELAILSGNRETTPLLDRLPAEVRNDPVQMQIAFHEMRKRQKEIVQ